MFSTSFTSTSFEEIMVALVRREIRSVPDNDQQRFVDALRTMMIDDDGSNVYSKLADIHGRFCAHGKETFPGWHRAYLVDFETAMKIADEKNGNDGQLSLPYWDWTNEAMNAKEPIPAIIAKVPSC